MNLSFDLSALVRGLDASIDRVIDGAVEGMHDATDDLLRESVNLAPLNKGTLRLSADKSVEVTGNSVVGDVTYSSTELDRKGNQINYALITHELGESFKNPTTPGTQPKYLERPLKAGEQRFRNMVANGIRRRLT